MYVGFCIGEGSGYHFFLDNPTASADLTVSDYVFFKSDDRGVTGGVAPTLDHFNDVLKGDVSWKPCQDHDVLTEEVKYFLLIFKIVAKDEFTAEDLSFSFNIWVQPAPE